MSGRTLVSFIIPIYNVESYLERCLKSVIAVKNKEIEIIIIDDGSSDKSPFIYEKYAKIDDRIKIIKRVNGGVAAARNEAIQKADGEWITFIDGDDEIVPEVYDFMMTQLNPSFELWVMGFAYQYSSHHFTEKKMSQGVWSDEEIELVKRGIFRQDLASVKNLTAQGFDFCGPCAKFYQRKIIIQNQIFFPENIIVGEDRIFNFLYMKYVNGIFYDNKCGYFYWQNNDSATHQFKKGKGAKCIESIELVRTILGKDNFLDYVQYGVRYYLYALKLDWCNPNNPDSYFVRKKEALKWRNTPVMQDAFHYFKFSQIRWEAVLVAFCAKMKWFFACDMLLGIKEKLHIKIK